MGLLLALRCSVGSGIQVRVIFFLEIIPGRS